MPLRPFATVRGMKAAPFTSLVFLVTLAPLLLAASACDKPDASTDKPAPSASASAAPSASQAAPPPSPATPATTASVASPASSATPTKDAVVSVRDPASQPVATANALAGGTVALYLPEWTGTTWKVSQPDKALGTPKEETIPGFAGPTTPAHAFTWPIKDSLKGQLHKVLLTNSTKGKAGAPGPTTSFTLNIDVS
jgi:hypothetical protein